MGEPIFLEALRQPITAVLGITLCAIFYLLHGHSLGYGELGMSYDSVVERGEVWRTATSQLSHVDLLHLLFNVSSLWSIGVVERAMGELYYVQQTALLFLLCPLICLGLYHMLITVAKQEQHRSTTAVGYSCVLFGWMTILAVKQPGGVAVLPIFGLADVPAFLMPFAALVLISILIPKASFLGHLSGILAGFILSSGLLDGIGPGGALGLLFTAVAGVAWFAAKHNQLPGYLQLSSGAVSNAEGSGAAGGGQLRIVIGEILRR